MTKLWIVFLLMACVLTRYSVSPDSPVISTSTSEPVQQEETNLVGYTSKEEIAAALDAAKIVNFHYIDESHYEGDELQIVQTLNRNMKGILAFDAEAVRSAYVREHAVHEEELSQVYAVAISMDEPWFNVLQDGNIEVFVKQKNVYFHESPLQADETTKLYLMQKEDSAWRILSITN
ncbi:hypothetical protein [Paenibacillus sp. MER 99-2]|uniref:hypothetical protein n=1 Tax=Paenibacillus sp. MER 99-2 TaxID=2939572 RepID=UPI002041429D|nr:hypothetical protein [Paenibacillus sp. MER 99-2]MCM3172021.1 hypothetical protein [Paenibacillus sp. MER 99-2]